MPDDPRPQPPTDRTTPRRRRGLCENCGARNAYPGDPPPPCRDCGGRLCEKCCDEAKAMRKDTANAR